jgi:hypothetical protein
LIAAFIALATAVVTPPPSYEPLDIFIGTIAIEQGGIILTRCDAARNRYLLRDGTGSDAIAQYRANGKPSYGEVVARYREEKGHPVLWVDSIDNLTPGRSCHLSDAINKIVDPDAKI